MVEEGRWLLIAAQAVFTLGVLWANWKANRKDVNGLGRKVRGIEFYLRETAHDEEHQRRITDLLGGK